MALTSNRNFITATVAAAAVAMSLTVAEPMQEDYIPGDAGQGPKHRRGRFKANQRKQKKGKKR